MGGSSSKTMSGQPFTIAAQARHTATVRIGFEHRTIRRYLGLYSRTDPFKGAYNSTNPRNKWLDPRLRLDTEVFAADRIKTLQPTATLLHHRA